MAMLADPIVQRIRQENESLRESGELHRQRIRMLRKARRTDRQKSEALKERLTDHWTITSGFLDDIIKYPEFLHAMTLRTPEKFDHTLNRLKELLERNGETALFWEVGSRSKNSGSRRILPLRHAYLLWLFRSRLSIPQEALATMFGVDQATVSRYLPLMTRLLGEIDTAPRKISEAAQKARTLEESKKIIPGRRGGELMVDGTHNRVRRSADKERRKKTYSGKKKAHTYNTNIVINKRRVIVAISKTVPGSVHDKTLLNEDPPNLGIITARMGQKDVPEKEKPDVLTDKGYQGTREEYPGWHIRHPYKKKPGADKKTGGLTKKQRAYNKRVNSSRVAIEHVIGNLKQYKRLTDPYDGTEEEYNDELNAIAGMVNQDLMWDEIKLRDADLLKRLAEERARL